MTPVPLRELLSEIIYSHADPDDPIYNECDIELCGWCWSAKAHLAEIYAGLAKDQEPLGAEFEAVWDANVDDLYEP